jgi:ubiquitin-conjugating enzyme E2 variant
MGRVATGQTRRTPTGDVLDVIAVAAVMAALGVLSLRAWRGMQAPVDAVTVVAMMAAGYLLADLLTGFVHWFCDTFFDETTPLIGPGLIAPFREHHRDPLQMTRHGFLELTGSSFRALAPVLALLVWLGGSLPAALSAFALALAAGAVATNLLHRWAHDPSPPPLARLLQRTGIVLTPGRHARHHQPPYAAAYCVTSGWMNPLCERLKVWTRAEAAFAALGFPVSGSDREAS